MSFKNTGIANIEADEAVQKIILGIIHDVKRQENNAHIIARDYLEYIRDLMNHDMQPSFYNSLYTPH